eukprot:gene7191-16876_t
MGKAFKSKAQLKELHKKHQSHLAMLNETPMEYDEFVDTVWSVSADPQWSQMRGIRMEKDHFMTLLNLFHEKK